VFAVAVDNNSVHLGNILTALSGGESATMENVERATGDSGLQHPK